MDRFRIADNSLGIRRTTVDSFAPPNQKPQNYRGFTQSYRDIRNPAHNGLVGRSNGVWLEVTPAQGTRALVKWNTLPWRRGKGALHPVGEDGAEKAVKGKTDDNARGRADERDARGDPQDVRAGRAERQSDAELCSALRDAVSDDAEDANQREPERHGREDAK